MTRRGAQRLWIGWALLFLLATNVVLAADPPVKAPPASKPPWRRLLLGEDAKKAQQLEQQIDKLWEAAQFEQVLELAKELAALRQKVQGADHWQTIHIREQVKTFQHILTQGPDNQKAMATVPALDRQADLLRDRGRFREEQPLREQLLAVRRKVIGEENLQTALSYNNLALNLDNQGKAAEAERLYHKALDLCRRIVGEDHLHTASASGNLGMSQFAQGKYAVAEANLRKALALYRKLLGEDHADTATGYNNLAINQNALGKYAEAERNFRKVLDTLRRLLGEEHPHTAASYNNLAGNQHAQGKYTEAEGNYLKALVLRRKILGEDHPQIASSYQNLAGNQHAQGKYLEAEENLSKALDLHRKLLGEEHPSTARCYYNLAYNQNAQAKYAEAERNFRKALDLNRKLLGEDHPLTATNYSGLATNQDMQGNYAEGERYHRKALELRRKRLGEDHPDTATSYHNLALNHYAQSKYAEAEQHYQRALDLYRKAAGEEHPMTAQGYSSLAVVQDAQGRRIEAERNHRKALALFRKRLGENHPLTVQGYRHLAANQHDQGKYAEAERLWSQAADRFDRTRLWIASAGLERAAVTSKRSPLLPLVAVLARNEKPRQAWQRFEESLARGTWDDLVQRRHLSAEQVSRRAQLLHQRDRLDRQLEQTLTGNQGPQQQKRAEELLGQRLQVQEQLLAMARRLEQQHGPAAGKVLDLADIQKALPADAALVGWIDVKAQPGAADPSGEHWAVLLRARGEPLWVRLPGTGPDRSWTEADERLADDLLQVLHRPGSDWQKVARRLRQQRLAPLAKHLEATSRLPAVRQLIVLPSLSLDGIPADVFAEGYTVSYAPSGTLLAHLRHQKPSTSQGLLVLADPVLERPGSQPGEKKLPPGGLLLEVVAPGSRAARAGLKPGDVLLRYGDTELQNLDNLPKAIQSHASDKEVKLSVWRDGQAHTRLIQPGPLGVVLARQPAPRVLAERRQLAQELALARRADDGDWKPLPGTRVEAEALRRLFEKQKRSVRLLADGQASEQTLDTLARKGDLGQYRFLHLATHGTLGGRLPLSSAVILSRDNLPDPHKQLDAGLPLYDGKLTAAEVLRDWHLQAELVTLSACQTALGKYEVGESFVGFPQALLLSGSRSVCVSLWQVHDTATALLMTRFYQNLLGAREGLKAPLPKAEALQEAKDWLRQLSRAEALKLAARALDGVERGKGRPALPARPDVPKAQGTDTDRRPFAHPYYWSAFVLIGDPS